MNYTLHQLKVFLKVAETTSITKAAEELHLTQPAVSIQLKKLQEQFDLPLVEVIGRQLYVTDFGREVVVSAQNILDEVEDIKNKTLAYKGILHGQLKISVVSTGKYVMPYFLSDFLQQHPDVELNMDVTNKSKVVESLESNEVDFALVSVLPNNFKIDRVELMHNNIHLVRRTNKDAPTKMTSKDLAKVRMIYRERGSATRQVMEKFISNLNISTKKTMALSTNEAIKQAVLAGLGYSVMSLIGLRNELANKELETVQAKGLPMTTQWNLIWLQQKNLSPVANAYLDFLAAHKGRIIKDQFAWYLKY